MTALAADIAEALGRCTICGVAIEPNRSAAKDGDGYRHTDCEPNSTLPDATLPASNAGGKPATTKTKREMDPMLRAAAKLVRLLDEMEPAMRRWALGYCLVKYEEKE